jgi:predicted PurR-regulated permease PerM
MRPSRDFERYAAIAAILLLVAGCYLVLRPFLTAFLWGGILAVSTMGIHSRLAGLLGGRRGIAAALTGLGLAVILLVPIVTLGLMLASQWPVLSERLAHLVAGGFPKPPGWVNEVPFVGESVSAYWQALAADPQRIAQDLRPLFKPVREFVVDFTAGLGAGILELALALLTASLLYVWGDALGAVLNQVALRIGGESGRRQLAVVAHTVRAVFNGVVGTAAVQALLAMIGFWIAGVPGVPLLGMGTFFVSVIPGGPALLWLPAALWLYVQGSTGWAIFMVLWGLIVVGGSDNVVRPLLIGKGVTAPLGVIFLGVIGGILAFGFLGLFIGPTVLVVAFNLFQDWISTRVSIPAAESGPPSGEA